MSLVSQIAIAIIQHTDHFLIGQRPPGSKLAGLWEFPGGKVEADESIFAAAVRETWEETGLEVVADGMLHRNEFTYDYGTVRLHFVNCQLICQDTPLLKAADKNNLPAARPPFRWIPREQLADFSFPAGNNEVLALLINSGKNSAIGSDEPKSL